MEDMIRFALSAGFTHVQQLNITTLEPMEQVRDMCAENRCRAYGKNWTCPPFCGTLDECREKIQKFQKGILVQMVGKLNGPFDYKNMVAIECKHLENFHALAEHLRGKYSEILCLGSGGCRICKKCAYPEPCRFPQKACSSMEGYGLMVSFVCRDNQMPYYYGENTLTYTSCYLWSEE